MGKELEGINQAYKNTIGSGASKTSCQLDMPSAMGYAAGLMVLLNMLGLFLRAEMRGCLAGWVCLQRICKYQTFPST